MIPPSLENLGQIKNVVKQTDQSNVKPNMNNFDTVYEFCKEKVKLRLFLHFDRDIANREMLFLPVK